MKACDQCSVSVGWFSRRKFLMPDGRRLTVCPSCADMLNRQATLAMGNKPKPEPSTFSRLTGKPEPREIDYRNPEHLEEMLRAPSMGGETETRSVSADKKTVVTVRTSTNTTTASGAEGIDLMRKMLKDMRDQPGITDDVLKQFDRALDAVTVKTTWSTKSEPADFATVDLQNRIVKACISHFQRESGIDVSCDPVAMQRLGDVARIAAQKLTTEPEYEVNVPFLAADERGPKNLIFRLKRNDL